VYLCSTVGHHHSHQPSPLSRVNTAFAVGIWLNLLFVIIEVAFGLSIHSMSLLSDAVHNFADVGTLVLSLVAFRLLKVKATDQYTYGYRKTSILVALFNSVILLVSIGGIGIEAIHKSLNPEPLPGATIALVAGIGMIINTFTALLFMKEKERDINIRSAYVHLMSDALVSAGIVVGGVLIYFTNWFWIDSVLSLLIAGIILYSTWKLLRESLRLCLDGVPAEISLQEIKDLVLRIDGVCDLHHVHVWALSSTENAMTAHLVLKNEVTSAQIQDIKNNVKHELEHRSIHHVTLETESESESCVELRCE